MIENVKKNRNLTIILATIVALIGIWYALPQTGLVFDEFFPGGVLRSISNHSILPIGQDILYGTITYYLSYIFIVALLVLVFPFVGFHVSDLKIFMLQNIHLSYLTSRAVSLIAFVICVYTFYKICEYEKLSFKSSLYPILLVFGSMIFITTFHTTKVWPVSILLLLISIYFLYLFYKRDIPKHAFISILFSFLAFANFPVMGFGLISILFILYRVRHRKDFIKKVFLYCFISFILFALISLINKSGIYAQIHSILYDYTLSSQAKVTNISILHSFILNIYKIFNLYTLIFISFIITILYKTKIRSKELFSIGAIYLIVYLLCISIVARWSTDLHSYLRYLIPAGLFLGIIFISLEIKINRFNIIISIIAILYLLKTLILLSVPTTGNQVYSWVKKNLNDESVMVKRENLSNIQLPNNKISSSIVQSQFCGTMCDAYITGMINSDFKSLIVTEQAKEQYNSLIREKEFKKILITDSSHIDINNRIKSFENGNRFLTFVPDIEQIGNYFDFGIFSLQRLGSNIYIYKLP